MNVAPLLIQDYRKTCFVKRLSLCSLEVKPLTLDTLEKALNETSNALLRSTVQLFWFSSYAPVC